MTEKAHSKDDVQVEVVAAEPDEKIDYDHANLGANLMASGRIELTQAELEGLEDKLPTMSQEAAREIMAEIYRLHKHDPRYTPDALDRIEMFVNDPKVAASPHEYEQLIYEQRILALLTSTSSAYPEVRAVASETDDPTEPSLTLRVWVIGTILCAMGNVINAIFGLRYPSIGLSQNVIQLVSFPLGVGWAKWLPDWKLFGIHLNPGPFNKKEHMLITIMSTMGINAPPTSGLIFVQALPQFFGMDYARNVGYQLLGGLSTNLMGFGFSGLCRRFLVWPSYCVWPFSLSTIALNNSLHAEGRKSTPVRGPCNTIWHASMYKCFWVVFIVYFLYFFFPAYIFPNLTIFDWIAWIKPTNGTLVAITSLNFGVGMGINPWPSESILNYRRSTTTSSPMPAATPMFVLYNFLIGLSAAILLTIVFWARNVCNSGYLQINSPATWDNKGESYTVTKIVDKAGRLIESNYQKYSEPYMAAARLTSTLATFIYTTGILTHTFLYNRYEFGLGMRAMWQDVKRLWGKIRRKTVTEEDKINYGDDIHYRLMMEYPEVPEWWFTTVLVVFMALGMICVGVYTEVSPAVVLIAPVITVIYIVPIGIVTAVGGLEPTLNVISELLAGGIAPGDTMTVQFVRLFGAEPVYHGLLYANNMKIGQYVKIPPRDQFWIMMWGGLLGTFVTVAQWTWIINLPKVCTPDAPFRLLCGGVQSHYTDFIFWGTLGPRRLFGKGGRYSFLLLGFPLGIAFPILLFWLKKRFRRTQWLQSSHPLLLMLGFSWITNTHWGTYVPGLFIGYFSWNFLKVRYLEFWTRYNYVTLASLSAAIGICALIVFFALVFPDVQFPTWWGNGGGTPGCIGTWTNKYCALYKIGAKGYFGPDPGQLH